MTTTVSPIKTQPSTIKPEAQPKSAWQKTPYPNLIRYVPSGTYFGRVKVNSKLIRRSLETHVLDVAKLRLSDFLKEHRRFATSKAPMVKGEAIVERYRQEVQGDHRNQPRTKLYKLETLTALRKTWPELFTSDIGRVTRRECQEWAARYAADYSPTRFNGALSIVRRIFALAVEEGYRTDNPATSLDRMRVKPKELHLPTQEQFHQMAELIETSGAGRAKDCATLFRFLAFSGVRINEARHITWEDVDFDKGQLRVRITKNGKCRWVPFNTSLAGLLDTLRSQRSQTEPTEPVMRVFHCKEAIDRSCRLLNIKRITHHDLRHLFATRCIEKGVDIPTVSRWLGHQDGGALCMKTYGHLRDEHSRNEALKVSF